MGIPITEKTPIRFDGPLPALVDVVVIGGGVIGVTTALFLARDGLRVALLEKGRIAGEQSGRNWGWIRQQGRDPDELPIMAEAARLWRELAAEAGTDIGLRAGGVTYLARDEAGLAKLAAWVPHATAQGIDTRVFSRGQIGAVVRGASGTCAGGLHTASDMRAEPWRAVPALAAIAEREGVLLHEGCAARALDVQGGRVTGVLTERGRVAAGQVVLAGGAWSALFLRQHGIFLPQLSVRASVAATQPLPEICAGAAADKRVAFRRRLDGGYTLAPGALHDFFIGPHALQAFPKFLRQLGADPFGTRFKLAAPAGFPDAWGTPRRWHSDEVSPFETTRILDPSPNRSQLEDVARGFAQLFPHIGPIHLRETWAGMIDTLPDVVPVVDKVAALPGLTLGTGFSGHGFGIGPGMGRVLCALVQDKDPGHDLQRFRLSRFRDGSRMELGPAL